MFVENSQNITSNKNCLHLLFLNDLSPHPPQNVGPIKLATAVHCDKAIYSPAWDSVRHIESAEKVDLECTEPGVIQG